MILEERNYTTAPGDAPKYLQLWQEEAREVQVGILGDLRGVWISEIGDLNTVVYQWGYESLAERERRRAELMADPVFAAFRAKSSSMLLAQRNRILAEVPGVPQP